MNANQRKSLAQRNGKRGGLSRVEKMKATPQGQEQMRWNALKSGERQKDIYGRLFVNLPGIARINEARLEARRAGGRASQEAQRRKKEATRVPAREETAKIPVVFQGDAKSTLEGAVFRG